jgi:FAD/FMN-containing dehydrogenase
VGSEGIFGIVTKVTLRVRPLPEHEEFLYFEFKSWEDVVKVGGVVTRWIGDEAAYSLDYSEEASRTGVISVRVYVFGYDKRIINHRKNLIVDICRANNGREGDPKIAEETFKRVVTGLPNIFTSGVWHFAMCGTIRINIMVKFECDHFSY